MIDYGWLTPRSKQELNIHLPWLADPRAQHCDFIKINFDWLTPRTQHQDAKTSSLCRVMQSWAKPSWGHLGPPWGQLWSFWGHLGVILSHFGATQKPFSGHSGVILRQSGLNSVQVGLNSFRTKTVPYRAGFLNPGAFLATLGPTMGI